MFEAVRIIIALIGSAAAGLWDLKTTEIPDWVCWVMIAAAAGFFGIEGYLTGSWSGLTASLYTGAGFLAFGLFMYFAGQWGGGDGELLIAIGMLLPLWPYSYLSPFPMPLSLFINVFFVGAFYSIAYSVAIGMRNNEIKRKFYVALKGDAVPIVALTAITLVVSGLVYAVLPVPVLLSLPVAVAVVLVLFEYLKVVETSFSKRIKTSKLREGDMIGEDIASLHIYKRQLRGLTKTEIAKIRRAKQFVMIRDGVRFGPVFPLALATTLLCGDLGTALVKLFI